MCGIYLEFLLTSDVIIVPMAVGQFLVLLAFRALLVARYVRNSPAMLARIIKSMPGFVIGFSILPNFIDTIRS